MHCRCNENWSFHVSQTWKNEVRVTSHNSMKYGIGSFNSLLVWDFTSTGIGTNITLVNGATWCPYLRAATSVISSWVVPHSLQFCPLVVSHSWPGRWVYKVVIGHFLSTLQWYIPFKKFPKLISPEAKVAKANSSSCFHCLWWSWGKATEKCNESGYFQSRDKTTFIFNSSQFSSAFIV